MVRLSRILRDYDNAGGLNELISLWGFVDDHVFLTKAGHVGLVYAVRGVDYEGLTHQQRQALVHQVEAGLRMLDDRCRIYQYVVKRAMPPIVPASCLMPVASEAIQRRAAYLNARRHHLSDIRLYLVIVYEAPHVARRATSLSRLWKNPRTAFRGWLSSDATVRLLESELDQAIATLYHKAQAFEVQVSECGLRPLPKNDAFRFFRCVVNDDARSTDTVTLAYDTHLDYFVSDCAIECYRDHLVVGDRLVKVLSMKEPPSHTFASVLRDVYELPGDLTACLEWQRIPADRMRRDLQARRRHFFNKRVSLVNYIAPDTKPEEMLTDDSATATVRQLGDALTETEVNGHFFGQCSLTLVLHGHDARSLQQQAAEARKVFAVHDGLLFDETYNLLNAWLSVIPGNGAHNVR
ncbi:MAG: hypothetical protein WBC51_19510, partial [Vicinamibacterales bacterium]